MHNVRVLMCWTCNCLKRDKFYILLQELCNSPFCHILVKSVFYWCRSINSGGEELCVIVVNSTTFRLYSYSCPFERHLLLAEYIGSETHLCLVFYLIISKTARLKGKCFKRKFLSCNIHHFLGTVFSSKIILRVWLEIRLVFVLFCSSCRSVFRCNYN